jgi:hypothetical protein
MPKSFYDLDYIIEINEQRVEHSHESYSKVLERITTLVIIYSVISFFIIPIFQRVYFKEIDNIIFIISFLLYAIFFITSIIFTILFMIPIEVAHLESPQIYYTVLRNDLETQGHTQEQIEDLLKVSYISELEETVNRNDFVFRRKSSLYYRALIYVLVSAIPYVICLGFHLSLKSDIPQKIQIVNMEKNSNFNKNKNMPENTNSRNNNSSNSGNNSANDSSNNSSNNAANDSSNNSSNTRTTSTQTTRYPGVQDNQIIQSHPRLIKENKENPSKKRQ